MTTAILDEIEAWRTIALSQIPANLQIAYQLGLLFDLLLTVTEDGQFEDTEDMTMRQDLTTIARSVPPGYSRCSPTLPVTSAAAGIELRRAVVWHDDAP